MKCAWPFCDEEATKPAFKYKSVEGAVSTTKPMCELHYDDSRKYLGEKGRLIK